MSVYRRIRDKLCASQLTYAQREEQLLHRKLRDFMRPDEQLTVLAYQPTDGGTFVDIGSRASGWPDERVTQSVHAGSTGKFITTPGLAARLRLDIGSIAPSDVESFKRGSVQAARDLQVELERRRYPDLPWPDAPLPPQGTRIGHLSIAPRALRLTDPRIPVFGVVYTLGKVPRDIHSRSDHLIHTALHTAELLFRQRLETLLLRRDIDEDRFSALEQTVFSESFGGGDLSKERSLVHELATSFVLAHHWFFPYDPVCANILISFGLNRAQIDEVYLAHGWSPPPFGFGEDPAGNLETLFDLATRDLAWLLEYYYRRIPTENGARVLRRCLWSALVRCAGDLHALEESPQRTAGSTALKLCRAAGSCPVLLVPRDHPNPLTDADVFVFESYQAMRTEVLRIVKELEQKEGRGGSVNAYRVREGWLSRVAPLMVEHRRHSNISRTPSHRITELLKGDSNTYRYEKYRDEDGGKRFFPMLHSRFLLERLIEAGLLESGAA